MISTGVHALHISCSLVVVVVIVGDADAASGNLCALFQQETQKEI